MGIFEQALQIIDEAIKKSESIGKLALWSGVSKSSLVKWSGRKCAPRFRDMATFLDALGYKLVKTDGNYVDDSRDDDYIAVPVIDRPELLEPGMIPLHNIRCWCHVNREYESVRGRCGDLIVIQVVGEDMAPTLPAGCQVLVDRDDRTPEYGKLFLVRHPHTRVTELRRLYINPQGTDKTIIFANDSTTLKKPIIYSLKRDYHGDMDRVIVGRAVWLRTPIFNK